MKKTIMYTSGLLCLVLIACTTGQTNGKVDLNDELFEAQLQKQERLQEPIEDIIEDIEDTEIIGSKKPAMGSKKQPTRRRKPETAEEKNIEKLLIFMETKFVPFAEQTAKIVSGKKALDEITTAKQAREQAQKAFANKRDYGRNTYSPGYSRSNYGGRSPYSGSGYGRNSGSAYGSPSQRSYSPSGSSRSPWGDYDQYDTSPENSNTANAANKEAAKPPVTYGEKARDEKDTTGATNRAINLQNSVIADLKKIGEYYDNFDGTDDDFSRTILQESKLSKLAQNIDQLNQALNELNPDEDTNTPTNTPTNTKEKQVITKKSKKPINLAGYQAAYEKAIPALARAATYVPIDTKAPESILIDQYKAISGQQKAANDILNQSRMAHYSNKIKAEVTSIANEQHGKFAPLIASNIKAAQAQTITKSLDEKQIKALEYLKKAGDTLGIFANNFRTIAPGHETKLTALIKSIENALEKAGPLPEEKKADKKIALQAGEDPDKKIEAEKNEKNEYEKSAEYIATGAKKGGQDGTTDAQSKIDKKQPLEEDPAKPGYAQAYNNAYQAAFNAASTGTGDAKTQAITAVSQAEDAVTGLIKKITKDTVETRNELWAGQINYAMAIENYLTIVNTQNSYYKMAGKVITQIVIAQAAQQECTSIKPWLLKSTLQKHKETLAAQYTKLAYDQFDALIQKMDKKTLGELQTNILLLLTSSKIFIQDKGLAGNYILKKNPTTQLEEVIAKTQITLKKKIQNQLALL